MKCRCCQENEQMYAYAICVACKVKAEKEGGVTIEGSWLPIAYLSFIKEK